MPRPVNMNSQNGFTIIEILVVICIIALVTTMASPMIGRAIDKAQSVKCMSNLRQIGVAVANFATENEGKIPKIETDPDHPIYEPEDEARGMLETLEPYGITQNALSCPSDRKDDNYFKARGNSYEWIPITDDENKNSPSIYRRSGQRAAKPSRVRITMDVENVHFGRRNFLFLDGHVRAIYN